MVEALDKDFVKRAIRAKANKDRVVLKALAEGQEDWEDTDDGLISYQGRIYIPRDSKLREDIIHAHHDSRIEGHPGQYKTQELINRNYWWPGISVDVKKYVLGCDVCQHNKETKQVLYGLLQPNDVPAGPWETITIDLITELPESLDTLGQAHTAILVVVCQLTKRAHFLPTSNTCTAQDAAELLFEHIF